MAQHLRALPFREPRERQDICRTVAELREEACDRLGGVIGTEHEQRTVTRDCVLRDHAHSRFHVALVEIAHRLAGRAIYFRDKPFDGWGDIDGHLAVGTNKIERELGIVFVALHRIRQPHGDELGLVARLSHPLHRELSKTTAQRRVLTTRDAEHESAHAGNARRVVDEKRDASLNLGFRVDLRCGGERLDNLLLNLAHDF